MTFDIRFNANARTVLHLAIDRTDDTNFRSLAKRTAAHLRDEYPIETAYPDDGDAVFYVSDQLLGDEGQTRIVEVAAYYVAQWYRSLSLRRLQVLLVEHYEFLSAELVLFNLLYAEGVLHLSTDPTVHAEFRARKNAWLANDPLGESRNADRRREVAASTMNGALEHWTPVDHLVAACAQSISGAGYDCAIEAAKIASRRSRFEFDAARLDNALADAIRVCVPVPWHARLCTRANYGRAALIVQEQWRNATRSE